LRTRLEPVKKVGRMIRTHLWGILNAIVHGVTNARLESINARIQWVKKMACGFRNSAPRQDNSSFLFEFPTHPAESPWRCTG
jgi:hypothetical protein